MAYTLGHIKSDLALCKGWWQKKGPSPYLKTQNVNPGSIKNRLVQIAVASKRLALKFRKTLKNEEEAGLTSTL